MRLSGVIFERDEQLKNLFAQFKGYTAQEIQAIQGNARIIRQIKDRLLNRYGTDISAKEIKKTLEAEL